VRELRNFAFGAVLGQSSPAFEPASRAEGGLKERVAAVEAAAITDAIIDAQGNMSEAISRLGLPRKTFYDKVARLKLDLSAIRQRARNG
jgi:two-component system C4-dicarboxylate transport response regulator DctD